MPKNFSATISGHYGSYFEGNTEYKHKHDEIAVPCDWEFIGSTSNETFYINGVDIFTGEWNSTGTTAKVLDPIYGVRKDFEEWTIIYDGKEITFAAGEFSNGVWGIYKRKQG